MSEQWKNLGDLEGLDDLDRRLVAEMDWEGGNQSVQPQDHPTDGKPIDRGSGKSDPTVEARATVIALVLTAASVVIHPYVLAAVCCGVSIVLLVRLLK